MRIRSRRGGPPIRTEQLRKVYGSLVAVDGLDLEVGRGEFFGLLGPNGAGKSTTIGMLTTTVVPTGGRALVSGLGRPRAASDDGPGARARAASALPRRADLRHRPPDPHQPLADPSGPQPRRPETHYMEEPTSSASGSRSSTTARRSPSTINFQGIQAVALPLVQEFSVSKEIEDRVLAPVPVWVVGLEKIVAGTMQALMAAGVVFPMVYLVHAHGEAPSVHVHDPVLFAVALLFACFLAASMGLFIGTVLDPRKVTLLFAVVVLPLTFLGCIYYPWAALTPVMWLKVIVLLNPLVYVSEGLAVVAHARAAAYAGLGVHARARRRLDRAGALLLADLPPARRHVAFGA